MPNVSLEYYDKEALTWIGNRIGIDINTSCQLRGHFARICVLVDLGKQLMPSFFLDGMEYYLEYEGLHWLCTNCGIYGHKADDSKIRDRLAKTRTRSETNIVYEDDGGVVAENAHLNYQEIWRVVHKLHRHKKEGKEKQMGIFRQQNRGSRVSVLTVEEGVEVDDTYGEDVAVPAILQNGENALGELQHTNVVRSTRERKGRSIKDKIKIRICLGRTILW